MKAFSMKRFTALMLCLLMLIGCLPVNVLAVEPRSSETVLDAAIFCSDVHDNPSTVTSVFNGIKSADSTFAPTTAAFVGDTQTTASSVTSAAHEVYSDVQCIYAFGNHDDEGDYGIDDFTGLSYGDSTTNYYIYTISENSMSSSSPDTSNFTSTVAGLDKTKPLFIISHMPLHARRGDNNGAAAWYTAISAAAKQMDIAFFWAHNHTSESNVDTAAYYIAKNGSETISIQGGSTVTPNFTYLNAGYIDPPNTPARNKVATAVRIYDDSINYTVYNADGELSGTYAVNETVPRAFASSTDSGSGDTDNGTTKEVYVLVDTMTVGEDYLIANGNTDMVTLLGQSSGSADTTTATVVTSGDYTYIEKADSGYVWNATAHTNSSYSSYPRLINAETYAMYASSGSLAFSSSLTSTSGAVYTRYWTYSDGQLACVSTNSDSTTYYLTYSDGYSMTSTATDGIYIYEKQTITVSSDGTVSGGDSSDGSTETVVGGATVTTADDGSFQKVSTTEKKTVYVLTSSITSGTSYLIVNGNSAGSYYALANNSGSVAATGVTVKTDSTIGAYIELTDATDDELWTASGSSSTSLKNGSYYLTYSGSNSNYSLDLSTSSTSSTSWTYSSNRLSIVPKRTTYYLVYDSGWDMSSSSDNIYFYVPTEVDGSVTYSVTASDIEHIYDSDDSTAETETIVAKTNASEGTYSYAIVSDESGIIDTANTTGSTLSFTGEAGTATVRVYYTFITKDGTEYKIWDTITVTATYPYYTVDITHNSDGTGAEGTTSDYVSVTDTISIKGVEANDTYDLWAKVYLNGETEQTVESSKLTWNSNNTAVAKVDSDGNVTFIGEEGTVQITVYYAYTNNEGETVQATDVVTFSVSKNNYVIPSDGTNDFPEYPNEGAIRFDKTATAVGNFSETGIAQVELSMTGVPYSTGSEIDVVIMLDMTGSMSSTAMTAAEESAIAFAEQIVKNEDGTYNNNRIAVLAFNSGNSSPYTYWELGTISADQWDSFCTAVRGASDDQESGGTPYDEALEKCQQILTAAKTDGIGNDRQQFCVFVSDGGPTSYKYITNYDAVKAGTATSYTNSTASASGGSNQSDSNFATIATYTHEYYSTLMKDDGVTMYSVLTGLSADDYPNCTTILQNIASDSSKAYVVEDGSDTTALKGAFANIALEIKQAATNVVVEDKIDSHYTVNFALPTGVTSTEAGMSEFYIQAVQYTLDSNKERTGDPAVLENFTFNADGTLKSHTVDGVTCTDCTHVTITDGIVTKIDGTYFDYEVTSEGEFFNWYADKLDTTELALQYFVYLDKSAGYNVDDQVAAGTYNTNEYATITYTNFNGNKCQQEFPVPQLTWNGAQVTYVFYLVNENGEPVNRAGKVVPFAEAVYVTTPYTYAVTWNELEGQEKMLAQDLYASAKVPDVYTLYDTKAYYEIRVYETESVDNGTTKNNDYFIIEGSTSGLKSYETTKVFNTKADTKYDDYGAYSATAGTYTSTKSNTSYEATVTTDIDYANTTVAFAVVWKPALVEDTVVIDFGLDVVIDVYTNDGLAAGVTGVMLNAPSSVTINSGTYTTAVGSDSVKSSDGVWTASKENLTSVRFHLNNMEIDEPAVFYYEAGVNYYTYDASNNATLNTTNMYSSVTVIPATTIYYEDDFVELSSYTITYDEAGNVTSTTPDENTQWTSIGTTINDTQDVDRPGVSQAMSAAYDANNLYGYDSAYDSMSTYSMGSAKQVKVDADHFANATFEFYGTGFDVISMTDKTSGAITVTVTGADGTSESYFVNNYYGYAYENGEWVAVDSASPNALYQVPVMKVSGLTYGKYTVTIKAAYNSIFDKTDDIEGESNDNAYTFILDAIRIYDPTGNVNDIANDAYGKDDEAWPQYIELRNNIIAASNYTVTENEDGTVTVSGTDLSGAIFIDGNNETTSIADYVSYGPNNELYLDAKQSVAFKLNPTYASNIADVQIGLKVANGGSVSYKIYDSDTTAETAKTINTATDMYYSIKDISSGTVVITNTGTTSGILSITNIKITYTQNPYGKSESDLDEPMTTSLYMDEVSATSALMSLRSVSVEEPEEEIFVPESFDVRVSSKSVKVGQKFSVIITTSADVESVSVNGQTVTKYKENRKTGVRTWSVQMTAAEAGDMTISAVAYDADGIASEAEETVVTVAEKNNKNNKKNKK
ncbi:MAG: VWA domain-containing protein [Clostridia bacterium]|nr:VWA domain-containing protein [Clostridia bacterium]